MLSQGLSFAAIALLSFSFTVPAATPQIGVAPKGSTSAHLHLHVTASHVSALLHDQVQRRRRARQRLAEVIRSQPRPDHVASQDGRKRLDLDLEQLGPATPAPASRGGAETSESRLRRVLAQGHSSFICAGVYYLSDTPDLGPSGPGVLEPAMENSPPDCSRSRGPDGATNPSTCIALAAVRPISRKLATVQGRRQ